VDGDVVLGDDVVAVNDAGVRAVVLRGHAAEPQVRPDDVLDVITKPQIDIYYHYHQRINVPAAGTQALIIITHKGNRP
jgi:hypothetical protein